MGSRLRLGHDLDEHFPAGKITFFDGFIQIALMAFAILANQASASASVRFLIPCWQTQWNLTQLRSPLALIMLKVCEPKPCMLRKLAGMPRSLMVIVT